MANMTRRDFGLLAVGAAAAAAVRPGAVLAQARTKPMRGVFIILTTPFTAAGEVDWEDLAREVAFADRSGVQAVVWPQGSSGVANLTKAERMRGLDELAGAVRGKSVALVLGVQGKDTRRCSSTRGAPRRSDQMP
jgi:hypothetical protein